MATNCEPLANVKFGRIGMPSCYPEKGIATASALVMNRKNIPDSCILDNGHANGLSDES